MNYINSIVVTFENTSQEFYFFTKIFHTGTNFEKTGTEACGLRTYLEVFKNLTIVISENFTKHGFAKN